MLTFYVPPGIGDFSAMYSKLCNMNREIEIKSSNDQPNRLSPFLDILPKVKNGGYAGHVATTAVGQTIPPGVDLSSLPDGNYFLSINQWLEDGGRVEDWVPGETTYHYEIENKKYISEISEFVETIGGNSQPLIGVYCSAYGNARHWGFWTYEKWREFLELVVSAVPRDTQFIFIGADYDLAISEYLHGWMESSGIQSHLTLGSFHIGATIELINRLDYFFSFPSGLGFLADVVNTPSMMWFPNNLKNMMYTFTDPENELNGRTLHSLFSEPKEAFETFKSKGLSLFESETNTSRNYEKA